MNAGGDEQMIGGDVSVPPRPDGSPAMQSGSGQGGYMGASQPQSGGTDSDGELGPFRTRLGSLVLDTVA